MTAWDHRDPFVMAIVVCAGDIDVLAHANNTAYINWCQDAAWQHSAELGIDVRSYRALDRAMVVRRAHYDYFAAALLGDELEVGTWLTASDGRVQMTRHFQVRRMADDMTLFRGDWELVCIKLSSGKPVRMPAIFMSQYLPALISS